MANIQAALNNMLSSAASGAFLYSQTPEFKKQAELKALKEEASAQEAESELINKVFEDETASDIKTLSAAERSDELTAEEYHTQKRLYQLTQDPQYFDEALKRTPSQRDLAGEVKEQQDIDRQAKRKAAEQAALQRQQDKINTERAQKEALEARRRILEGTVPADRFNELMKEVR